MRREKQIRKLDDSWREEEPRVCSIISLSQLTLAKRWASNTWEGNSKSLVMHRMKVKAVVHK